MSEIQDQPLSQSRQPPQSRRALLAGAGVTCAAALAGCTTYDANNGGFAGPPPAAARPAWPPVAARPLPRAAALPQQRARRHCPCHHRGGPGGGGKIIDGPNIVITQPEAGSFKAFTAVCTHQGCIVSTVSNGTIDCPCHGSKFSIKDGSVVNGPATSPLAPSRDQGRGNLDLPGLMDCFMITQAAFRQHHLQHAQRVVAHGT